MVCSDYKITKIIMKNAILKGIEYVVYSSRDGKSLSLMLTGFFNLVVVVGAVFGYNATGVDFPALVDSIVRFVATVGTMLAAWQVVYGGLRKAYLSFYGKNKSLDVVQ